MIEEKLAKIAQEVYDYNWNEYGRLFTPEQIFAEYALYYEGIDFEIDPKAMEKLIDEFYNVESASTYEYPIYTIKLDNLSKEDYDYFYERLNEVFMKILEDTDSEWLKGKIKSWLKLE